MQAAGCTMGTGIQLNGLNRGNVGGRGLGPIRYAVDQKNQGTGQDMKKFSERQKGQTEENRPGNGNIEGNL